jgi:uncharacterized protein YeaO (DUF488 family)
MIRTKRVYESQSAGDGARFLVDRLWPRGLTKEKAGLDGWFKEVSPSDELRKWYHHDPGRWEDFKRRYFAELDSKPEAWKPLLKAARAGDIVLLFSSREERFNNAAALKSYLEKQLKKSG